MRRMLNRLIVHEHGQSLAEYAFILVLIAIVVVTALTNMGDHLLNVYNNVANRIP